MKDLKLNLLRHHQREELKAEIEQMDATAEHAKPEDKTIIARRKERAKKQLNDGSPEPLTGAEKDKLHSLEKRLREKIIENMPPDEVMRKNPAGAIDWQTKWEKINKPLILMWKNVKIQLNPDSSDRDLSNIERYRPSGQMDRFRSDAQIPGVMSFTGITDEQWPFETPINTALAQAQKRYDEAGAESDVNKALETLDIKKDEILSEGGFGPSGKLSAEEYASLETRLAKGREVLAKKRIEKRQLEAALSELPATEEAFAFPEAAD